MIVYRLNRKKYRYDLNGKGAEIAGGRWNSKGVSILYTGENRSLCLAEIAVHIPVGIVPKDYFLTTIQFPDTIKIKSISLDLLPKGWSKFPYVKTTKAIGDLFVRENKNLVLKVPSAVVQGEYNFLINPIHKYFNKVNIKKTEAFKFDKRLFNKKE